MQTKQKSGILSFFGNNQSNTVEMKAKFDAINKSQGVIEFNMDGTVITGLPQS